MLPSALPIACSTKSMSKQELMSIVVNNCFVHLCACMYTWMHICVWVCVPVYGGEWHKHFIISNLQYCFPFSIALRIWPTLHHLILIVRQNNIVPFIAYCCTIPTNCSLICINHYLSLLVHPCVTRTHFILPRDDIIFFCMQAINSATLRRSPSLQPGNITHLISF